MKKIIIWVFMVITAFSLSLFSQAAIVGAPDFDISAEAIYLYNTDTDTMIWEKNSDKKVYPASLTKIMTAIIAIESTPNLDSEMVVYPTYVQNYLYEYQLANGRISLGGMMAGEELTMRQMLYAIMVRSANEAAMSIAHHISGSQEDFAALMTKRAKELGATGTNFVNANGLFDEQQYTTAKDMAILTKHAMTLPGFVEIATAISYSTGETNKHDTLTWETTNYMMVPKNDYYYPYLQGMKTGTLPESGFNLVSTATRDGFTYLLVVIGSPYYDDKGEVNTRNGAFVDTKNIYEWVFTTFKRKSLVEKGKYVKEIPLKLAMDKDFLQLMTVERFTALVPNNIDASSVTMVFDLPESINAPIKKGDFIGTATLMLSGEDIGKIDLVSAETVEASPMMIVVEKAKLIFKSFWFKFAVIFIIILIILYFFLIILRNRRRKRSGNYRPRRRL